MLGQLLTTTVLLGAFTPALGIPELLERNFAYRSPYANQPGLALDMHSINKRHFQAGEQIRREHHHQLSKRDNGISGPVESAPMPEGEDGTYLYTGFSAQTANHGNAPYVYAGQLNFTHSVASGDPYDTSVLLWTRVEPISAFELHIPMCVRYKVYEDESATGEPVSEGYALTNADVDFTVKVEADGLDAATWYWYQFSNCVDESNTSPVGRTKTAPGYKATEIGTQRFSVFSCSNFPEGFFSAYSAPVLHDDTDYVIHLGDYIYEYGTAGTIGRNASKGRETYTLDDYRQRYAQYRTDQDLLEMHRLFPIIAIWDDHETANNDWKAGSSNSNDSIATGGCAYSNNTVCFTDRAINAKRAYHEWIPLRQVDLQDEGRIWREFNFGNLIDLFALDTRKYDRDVTDVGWNNAYIREVQFDMESDRSITGMKQERWLLDSLYDSQKRGSHWRLLLNQVQFGSCDETFIFTEPQDRVSVIPTDSWNGYQAQRLRIIREIYDKQIDNVAIVTGDSHSNWMYEITESTSWRGDPDPSQIRQITETSNSYQRGQIVEYAGTAVSSNGWGSRFGNAENATEASARGVEANGALLYSEGFQRGYMHLAVNYTHLVTTYFAYPGTPEARVADNRTMAVQFVQENGYNQVQRPLPQPKAGGFGAVKPGN